MTCDIIEKTYIDVILPPGRRIGPTTKLQLQSTVLLGHGGIAQLAVVL
jgi:hypothetical protein